MSRTNVKKKFSAVIRRKGEWDKAIGAVEERLRLARERVQTLEGILGRFRTLKASGEQWPRNLSATQN